MLDDTLSIGELARRTGLPSATLRVWETRYGFPQPGRDASGRRAYSVDTVDLLKQVIDDREKGLGLTAAIARAQATDAAPSPSLNAFLRRRSPTLPTNRLTKHKLAALTRAMEDEGHARAGRTALIAAGFQEYGQYERVQARWDDLVTGADTAIVFTDFTAPSVSGEGPIRVPVDRHHPLNQEWFVIWSGERFTACLSGRELPGQSAVPNRQRVLETVWTVDGDLVAEAARSVTNVATDLVPGLSLDATIEAGRHSAVDERDMVYAITNRLMADLER